MNTLEMHTKVRGQIMEENTPEYDLLTDEMIDEALTSVSIEFSREQVKPDPRTGKIDLSRVSNIYTLVKTYGKSFALDVQPFDKLEVDLPEKLLQPLPSTATTQRIIPGTPITNLPSQQYIAEVVFHEYGDEYSVMDNPFSTSSYKRLNSTFSENKITFNVGKRTTVIDISLKYICIPNKISLLLYKEDAQKGLCDLPEGVHNTIVEQAVRYLLEQLQSSRNQRS